MKLYQIIIVAIFYLYIMYLIYKDIKNKIDIVTILDIKYANTYLILWDRKILLIKCKYK